MESKWVFIINPIAGAGYAKKYIATLKKSAIAMYDAIYQPVEGYRRTK